MKRTALILIALSGCVNLFAQGPDLEQLLVRKTVDCRDISLNSSVYYAKFMQEGKLDSVMQVLDYWESKCGSREPVYRARILTALQTGTFDESMLGSDIMSNILIFSDRIDMILASSYYNYDSHAYYYGYVPPGQEFDKYTLELASKLSHQYPGGSVEYLMAELYSGNTYDVFRMIQSDAYKDTAIAGEYYALVDDIAKEPELHMAFMTGAWLPTGRLSGLGPHMDLGMQFGWKKKRMNYDFTLMMRFLNAPNDYKAYRNETGSWESTRDFFGGYIGFDVGYDLYARKGHEVQLTGGVAFDGFTALDEDKQNGFKPANVNSYNVNAGVGYRYYLTNKTYLGLKVKYNVIDYTLSNVLDMRGNALTVHFYVGWLENAYRNNKLRTLRYEMRK